MHTRHQPSAPSHSGSIKRNMEDRRPVSALRQKWQRFSLFIGRHAGLGTRHPYLHANSDIDDASIWTASADSISIAKSIYTTDEEDKGEHTDDGSTRPLLSSSMGLSRIGDDVVAKESSRECDRPLSFSGVEVEHITILTRDGQTFEWSRPKSIMEWPEAVRKQVWRKAVVNDNKLMICDCEYCLVEDMSALQPALAQISKAVRKEVLATFYKENQFIFPIGHKREHGVRDWLDAIGHGNRQMLQHVELAPLNADTAIKTLAVHYRLHRCDHPVIVEDVDFDDGHSAEVQWFVFTAEGCKAIPSRPASVHTANTSILDVSEQDAKRKEGTIKVPDGNSLSSSDDKDDLSELTVMIENEGSSIQDSLLDTSSPTSFTTVVEPRPPQLDLRRPNGDEWGDPRWSFAGKFNDHLVKRLASREDLSSSEHIHADHQSQWAASQGFLFSVCPDCCCSSASPPPTTANAISQNPKSKRSSSHWM